MFFALVAFAPAFADALVVREGRSFLGANMQPDVVAHSFKSVESEWRAQAALFVECDSADTDSIVNCQDAPASFHKSCGTAARAVVQGSNGDKVVAQEYMKDVCGQSVLRGWYRQQCQALALALKGAMSDASFDNRVSFNSSRMCDGFWSRLLKERTNDIAEEKAARLRDAAQETVAQELEGKKASADAARKEADEAAGRKVEAMASAKEATKLAMEKKAEVALSEAVAKAAQQKVEQASPSPTSTDTEKLHSLPAEVLQSWSIPAQLQAQAVLATR